MSRFVRPLFGLVRLQIDAISIGWKCLKTDAPQPRRIFAVICVEAAVTNAPVTTALGPDVAVPMNVTVPKNRLRVSKALCGLWMMAENRNRPHASRYVGPN